MVELEELIAEQKNNGSNDPLEFEFLQTKATGIRQLLELLQHKILAGQEEPATFAKQQNAVLFSEPEPLTEPSVITRATVAPEIIPEKEPELPEPERQETKPVTPEEKEPETVFPAAGIKEFPAQPVQAEALIEEKLQAPELLVEIKTEPEPSEEASVPENIHTDEKMQPDVLEEPEKKDDPVLTLGEKFAKEKSVNDMVPEGGSRNLDYKLSQRPVSNLQSAIGINDRFLFTRELFEGDSSRFAEAVKKLDQLDSINDAVSYLRDNYKWKKSEASLKFVDLIKRRFAHD